MFQTKFFQKSHDNKYLVVSSNSFIKNVLMNNAIISKFIKTDEELELYLQKLLEKKRQFVIFEKSNIKY